MPVDVPVEERLDADLVAETCVVEIDLVAQPHECAYDQAAPRLELGKQADLIFLEQNVVEQHVSRQSANANQ